jgi:hypothetical protein
MLLGGACPGEGLLTNPKPALSLGGRNRSSCPIAGIEERLHGSVQRPHSNTLRVAPFDNTKNRLGGRERHVVGHDRLGETLEGERANLFGCEASL